MRKEDLKWPVLTGKIKGKRSTGKQRLMYLQCVSNKMGICSTKMYSNKGLRKITAANVLKGVYTPKAGEWSAYQGVHMESGRLALSYQNVDSSGGC